MTSAEISRLKRVFKRGPKMTRRERGEYLKSLISDEDPEKMSDETKAGTDRLCEFCHLSNAVVMVAGSNGAEDQWEECLALCVGCFDARREKLDETAADVADAIPRLRRAVVSGKTRTNAQMGDGKVAHARVETGKESLQAFFSTTYRGWVKSVGVLTTDPVEPEYEDEEDFCKKNSG